MFTMFTKTQNSLTHSPAAQVDARHVKRGSIGILKGRLVQAKFIVGPPKDEYEQEADRVADHVMRISGGKSVQRTPRKSIFTPWLQRQSVEEEEEAIQTKPFLQRQPIEEEEEFIQSKRRGPRNSVKRENMENSLARSKGNGFLLPSGIRSSMENAIGADFGQVKVHTDNVAERLSERLNAQAFTHQNDIYFNSGTYNPGSSKGKHLLAHELTHVVQQNGDNASIQRQEGEERYEAATDETEPATSLSPDAVLPIVTPQLPLFDLKSDMRFKLLFMPPQPDIPALIRPFTMRGLLVSDREFNSILHNWGYAYNFYSDLGLDPDSSKWLADKSMSFAYDTQLSLEYPNLIESMEQSGQLPESRTLSIDVFSF